MGTALGCTPLSTDNLGWRACAAGRVLPVGAARNEDVPAKHNENISMTLPTDISWAWGPQHLGHKLLPGQAVAEEAAE